MTDKLDALVERWTEPSRCDDLFTNPEYGMVPSDVRQLLGAITDLRAEVDALKSGHRNLCEQIVDLRADKERARAAQVKSGKKAAEATARAEALEKERDRAEDAKDADLEAVSNAAYEDAAGIADSYGYGDCEVGDAIRARIKP